MTARGTRREELLEHAARLFAVRGFHGTSIEDLGAAVGISGPGLYKHFPSKDAVLGEMLEGISSHLLDGGRAQVAGAADPQAALDGLLSFHTSFALSRPELIRVQDRDLENLSADAARRVRRLQRAYVEVWVDALTALEPLLDPAVARTRAHAVFGLLNSTPHSAQAEDVEGTRSVLTAMARSALGRGSPAAGSGAHGFGAHGSGAHGSGARGSGARQ